MLHLYLLFIYILVWLYQTRIGLSLYDVAGQGFLRESACVHFFNQNLFIRKIKFNYS